MTTPPAKNQLPLVENIKDAAIAGAIALLLAIPMLAVKIVWETNAFTLKGRWWLALAAFFVVAAGRLAWTYCIKHSTDITAGFSAIAEQAAQPLAPILDHWTTIKPYLPAALITLVILFPFLPTTDRYLLDIAILVLIYVMLGWGLNIVVGLAGLLDLGYVAFYAVGAYSFALLATNFGLSFWICLPLAGIFAAMWGILLGFPVLRLRGDYLAIVTLAFGEIIHIVLVNWTKLTNGPNGISQIPSPTLFGIGFRRDSEWAFHDILGISYSPFYRMTFFYFIILALVAFTHFVTTRLKSMPIGRAWEALREDEIASRSLGINMVTTKLSAFSIGAMFGGFAGAFFATRQEFISPQSFTFIESAIILAIVVLGGMGSQLGVAIAAAILIGGFELFRNLDFLKQVFGADFNPSLYRMLIFGLAMVIIMVWRPRGLIATRKPSIVLEEQKAISGELVKEGRG